MEDIIGKAQHKNRLDHDGYLGPPVPEDVQHPQQNTVSDDLLHRSHRVPPDHQDGNPHKGVGYHQNIEEILPFVQNTRVCVRLFHSLLPLPLLFADAGAELGCHLGLPVQHLCDSRRGFPDLI